MNPTTILLPDELKRQAKVQAIRDRTSLAEVIRRAVEHYLEHRYDDDPFMKRIDRVFGRAPRRPSEPPSRKRGKKSKL